jgi:D-3-phosphoglycerate dehydrogenase / 2-oxoglutarate reductase
MRILCTTSSFNKSLFPDNLEVVYNPYNRKLTETELVDLLIEHQPIAIVAGIERITKKALSVAKNLRVISRVGAGVDSIDIEAANELGIKIFNTPDAVTDAVAELTLGLIIDLLRGISFTDRNIRAGKWIRFMGNLLSGKTIGIIGCGRIGTKTANYLSSFGCKILGYDKYLDSHKDIRLTSLDTLFAEADIISLHLPLSDDTHHFIDASKLNMMKKTCSLVNASRGGLIDENALFNALSNSKIRSAAIDCFDIEPYNGKLIELDNVLLTSHIGSYAVESRYLMEYEAMNNLMTELKKL